MPPSPGIVRAGMRRLGGREALALLLALGGLEAVLGGRMMSASKQVWRVAISGNSKLMWESRATYEEYLNETVGPLFSPPIRFEAVGVQLMDDVFAQAARGGFDFIQGSPTSITCLEEEFDMQVLATRVGVRGGVVTDAYGSIIFTRADNTEINTIEDMKDKIVIASTISGSSGCLFGWKEMVDHGMSLMQEPKQVVFIGNAPGFEGQVSLLEAVLQGVGDVGFMPVRALEQISQQGGILKDKDGTEHPASTDLFKYINAKEVTLGSYTYPFKTSTDLYPEHSLGYLPNVDFDVRTEVLKAIHALNETSPAVVKGRYNRWLPPASFKSTRNMMVQLGLMAYDDSNAALTCTRQGNLYDAITCPRGTFKLSKERVASSCEDAHLHCPSEYECICRPCKAARAIEVRPEGSFMEEEAGLETQLPCTRMGTCLTRQQKAEVRLVMEDNRFRTPLNVTWMLHVREGMEGVGLYWREGQYNLSFSTAQKGLHLLEVFVDGNHIDDSPFFVEIVQKECKKGSYRVANDVGDCLCMERTIEVNGKCVMEAALVAGAAAAPTTSPPPEPSEGAGTRTEASAAAAPTTSPLPEPSEGAGTRTEASLLVALAAACMACARAVL